MEVQMLEANGECGSSRLSTKASTPVAIVKLIAEVGHLVIISLENMDIDRSHQNPRSFLKDSVDISDIGFSESSVPSKLSAKLSPRIVLRIARISIIL